LAETFARRWVCVFNGRSGGHARALFATRNQARQFAERHALSFVPADSKLNWVDSSAESSVLTTQVGNYLVARIDEPEGSASGRHYPAGFEREGPPVATPRAQGETSLTDPEDAGDVDEAHAVSDLAAQVKVLQDLIRQARRRGLTPEQQASLADLTRSLREALRRHELN
jgi:hypothetical protein